MEIITTETTESAGRVTTKEVRKSIPVKLDPPAKRPPKPRQRVEVTWGDSADPEASSGSHIAYFDPSTTLEDAVEHLLRNPFRRMTTKQQNIDLIKCGFAPIEFYLQSDETRTPLDLDKTLKENKLDAKGTIVRTG